MIQVVGIGPGDPSGRTHAATLSLQSADIFVGYHKYIDLVRSEFPEKPVFSTGMQEERQRCERALDLSRAGQRVSLICSGDSQVYGMAALLLDIAEEDDIIEIIPGVTAALSAAAILGAPLSGDFTVLSLSDLLTPWSVIQKRLSLAAQADMPIVLYNPCSHHRPEHLMHACDVLLSYLPSSTICGYVRNISRPGQESLILSLDELRTAQLDMFTTVIIGCSTTHVKHNFMITERGYPNLSL